MHTPTDPPATHSEAAPRPEPEFAAPAQPASDSPGPATAAETLSVESRVQGFLKLVIMIGFVLFVICYFAYVLFGVLSGGWILTMVKDQSAATVVLAFAVLVSLFIVLLLQYSTGRIRFKVAALEFEGASGPIVLWVMCFMAVTTAIKLLWL